MFLVSATVTSHYRSATRCSRNWTTTTTPRHSRKPGVLYYRGSMRCSLECRRRTLAKTKLHNVWSGLPSSTVMVSVVGCPDLRQSNMSRIGYGMDTGALVSHPPHWDNLIECCLIITAELNTYRPFLPAADCVTTRPTRPLTSQAIITHRKCLQKLTSKTARDGLDKDVWKLMKWRLMNQTQNVSVH